MENIKLIEYYGIVHYETIGELIHKFKQSIHTLGVQTGTYKKVLLVMIESLENIMKYSDSPLNIIDNDQLFAPAFTIHRNDNKYIVISSNPVNLQVVPSLKNKLDYLNNLDQQGLKDFYKETITNGEFSKKGGAGLGLIEMSKISGKMITYEFSPIDEKYARFTQRITIEDL